MQQHSSQSLTISLKQSISTDVLVVGGGAAGIAAAIAAGRRGCKTLLAEREYVLGGTAVSGLVGPFMTCSNPDGSKKLIRGLFEEIVDRMISDGGATDPMTIKNADAHSSWHMFGHRNVTPFSSETFKFTAEEMCLEAGVKLLYGVQACAVERTDDNASIAKVVFLAKEGFLAVTPKIVIDCTGDGDIAYLADCPMMKGADDTGEMQAAGLFFSVEGFDEDILNERAERDGWQSMRFEKEIAQAMANGDYPIPRKRLGIYKSCDGTWRANITRIPDIDGTKSESLTESAIEGRKQIKSILRFLRKYVKGAENVRLVQSAAAPGIRETRRIKGDFILEEKDLEAGTVFEDTILICSNSRDVHIGTLGRYVVQDKVYSLPYRMLLPAGVNNLLAAGRCVSCDRAVLSAIRVMPPCFGMGQAAGNAAALAIQSNTTLPEIDVPQLQERLRQENVVLND